MTDMSKVDQELAAAGAYLPSADFAAWAASLSDSQRDGVTLTEITSRAAGN